MNVIDPSRHRGGIGTRGLLALLAMAAPGACEGEGAGPITLDVELSGTGHGRILVGVCPLPSEVQTSPPRHQFCLGRRCALPEPGGASRFVTVLSTSTLTEVASGVHYCLRVTASEGSVFEDFSGNCVAGDLAADEANLHIPQEIRLARRFTCRVRFGLRTPPSDGGPALDGGDARPDIAATDGDDIVAPGDSPPDVAALDAADATDAGTDLAAATDLPRDADAATDLGGVATDAATTDAVTDAATDRAPIDRPTEGDATAPTSCAIRTAPGACAPGVDPGCGIVDVSLGGVPSAIGCAVFLDGSVRCWSSRSGGAVYLGNGAATSCVPPGLVQNLTGVSAIRQGSDFLCAVRERESMPVWCWGSNFTAQFGTRTPTESRVPIATPIPMPDALVIGGASGFSIRSPGVVTAWGRNHWGQLGDGTVEPPGLMAGVAPHTVMLPGLLRLSLEGAQGQTACGVFTGGEVRCWGDGSAGQLGTAIMPIGPTTRSLVPVVIPGITDAIHVHVGGRFVCATRTDNTVWCWGYGNDPLMLGAGTRPLQVIDRAVQVVVGSGVACVLRSDSTVWCWGDGSRVGNGGTDFVVAPEQVRGVTGVTRIFAGGGTVCALRGDADLWCWGNAAGNGTSGQSAVPVPIVWGA